MAANGKLNCWEYTNCGREPGGPKASELGPCTAATKTSLDGYNSGTFGGRACWVIPGTLCNGVVCGDFNEKYATCRRCEFFELVHVEQGVDYVDHVELLLVVAREGDDSPPSD